MTTPAADADAASIGTPMALRMAFIALVGTLLLLWWLTTGEGEWTSVSSWAPSLGIALAFRLDGLSQLFALIILAVGCMVFIYAAGYFRGSPLYARVVLLLGLFAAAMLGLVLADDLIMLYVFWELTTVSSFLLIGYSHADPAARRAALMGLLITTAGGLAMLVAFLLLGEIAGTYRISELLRMGPEIRAHPLYPLCLAGVLAGAFTKSAQFPLHFWLPGAMAAPTPVSAYLHSATMVKAGIYLLARLTPALGETEAWFWILGVTGAVTAVWAALMAIRQSDLKLMLAWTTVIALGLIVMLLGAGIDVSVKAALTFVLVHALYKSALFFVVGNLDHGAGSRLVGELGGLWRAMPLTATAALLAALSMAGFPPFLGSIGKDLKYEGALAISEEPALFAAAATIANALAVTVALVILVGPFLGRRRAPAASPHDPGWLMLLPPLGLATTGLVLGIDPDLVFRSLIGPAAASVLGADEPVYVTVEKGLRLALLLTAVTLGGGIAAFLARQRLAALLAGIARHLPLSGDRAFDATIKGLKALAAWQTGLVQTGRLTHYLTVTFLVAAGVPALALLRSGFGAGLLAGHGEIRGEVAFVMALMVAAALVVAVARSRLLAICALGIVGYGTALLFVVHGAVDVAITQLLVETLFVLIVASVLLRLPGIGVTPPERPAKRVRDMAVAAAFGGTVCALLLVVSAVPADRRISAFYERVSYVEAYGRNVVNVILVDFRALDTLGEIAVVAAAALGILAVLRFRRQEAGP